MNVKDSSFPYPPPRSPMLCSQTGSPAGEARPGCGVCDSFIQSLKDKDPKDTNHLILGIQIVDDDEDDSRREFLDACLFKKDDLVAKFDWDSSLSRVTTLEHLTDEQIEELAQTRILPDSYAYDLSPWSEILGYEVDPDNAFAVGPVPLATSCPMGNDFLWLR